MMITNPLFFSQHNKDFPLWIPSTTVIAFKTHPSVQQAFSLSNWYLPVIPVKSNREKSTCSHPFCRTETATFATSPPKTNCAFHSPESRKFFRAAEDSNDYLLRVTESLEDLSVQVVAGDDISRCLPGLWQLRSDLLVLQQTLQEREVHQLQQASNCLFLPHFINNWEGWIHKARGDSACAKTDPKEDNSPSSHRAYPNRLILPK